MNKECRKCKIEKSFDEFHNHKAYKDGKALYCKPCNNSMMKRKTKEQANKDSKKYALKNPEKVKKSWSVYYNANKEKLAAKRKESERRPERIAVVKAWNENNKGLLLAQRKVRRDNPSPRQILEKKIRDRFYKVIIRMKSGTKHTSPMNLIGCSVDYLKLHIENQFKEGMAWSNHGNGEGKWNIDHIRPLCTFDLHSLDEQVIAFNYTNLRPLWFVENISRGRKNWQVSA